MSGKVKIHVRSYRIVLFLSLSFVILGGRTAEADDCPYEFYSRATLPARDWRITIDDASFPQLEQGESSSISLEWGEKWLVAWQSVNADLSLDNDIYCMREIDNNAPGTPNFTDCPLPLTLEGDGARHTAPSGTYFQERFNFSDWSICGENWDYRFQIRLWFFR